jgi:basic membrane protein A
VITSDLKEVGKSIYTIFKMILDGTFERGKVYSFGVKEGMVGLAIDEYTRKILPEDVVQKIIDIQNKVASGEIKVEPYRP